jgi:hypothetical protein
MQICCKNGTKERKKKKIVFSPRDHETPEKAFRTGVHVTITSWGDFFHKFSAKKIGAILGKSMLESIFCIK